MTDPTAIFESAYSLTGDEQAWLNQLGQAIQRNSEDGRWVVAFTYESGRPNVGRAMACCGVDERDVIASSSRLFSPFSGFEPKKPWLSGSFVRTLRQFPARYRRLGVDEARIREFERVFEQWLRDWDMGDELWVNAQDPTGMGCCIGAPLRRPGPLSPRETHRWSCIAAHVATAFRIRRQFSTLARAATHGTTHAPEAVFLPDGKLEHAVGAAKNDRARVALREAVLALDRARGSSGRCDSDEAVATWRAMVAGRWSLLDHFDSNGRRFVVAHRNDARALDTRGLTLRERQVLAYVALGHSNKVIAYELGLATSTVAGHLARARVKLQLPLGTALQLALPVREN